MNAVIKMAKLYYELFSDLPPGEYRAIDLLRHAREKGKIASLPLILTMASILSKAGVLQLVGFKIIIPRDVNQRLNKILMQNAPKSIF